MCIVSFQFHYSKQLPSYIDCISECNLLRSEGASFSAVDLSGEEEKKMYTPGQTCTKPPVLTAMSPVRVSPTGLA